MVFKWENIQKQVFLYCNSKQAQTCRFFKIKMNSCRWAGLLSEKTLFAKFKHSLNYQKQLPMGSQ